MLTRKALMMAGAVAVGVLVPLAALRPSASAQGQPRLLPDAPPPHYAVTELAGFPGVPPLWDSGSGPHAINDRGQIAGSALFPTRSQTPHGYFLHAALWDARGYVQNLRVPDESSAAWHINNTGQVLGAGWGKLGGDHLFLYSSGHLQALRDLPGVSAFLAANHVVRVDAENGDINGGGLIALNVEQKAGNPTGYVYGGGQFQAVGLLPGGHGSEALAINSPGQVVGRADTNGQEHAFLWEDGGGMTDLGALPGFDGSAASAVNAVGQVIGTLTHSRNYRLDSGWMGLPHSHGFCWQDGRMQDLGALPGCDYTQPTGINNVGQIVGNSYRFHVVPLVIGGKKQSGTSRSGSAFLWQKGRMYDLSRLVPAGWQIEQVRGINNRGQIVGIAGKNIGYPARDHGERAVLLTPQ